MKKKNRVVTIDGPSGSGKSSVARALARELGFRYLDTGAMYRAATLAVLRAGIGLDPVDGDGIVRLLEDLPIELDDEGRVLLQGERVDREIREGPVNRAVSIIAALAEVRVKMVALQRSFAGKGDVVVEGRDIGTVVFPDARHRFFLDADPAERARRRARQKAREGWGGGSENEVLAEQAERDRRDSERVLSPLVKGPGVVAIDTTAMTLEEVVKTILRRIEKNADPG